jgi:hypothetical protein
MFRNAAGAIAGLVTAFVLIMLIEKLGHFIYPPPPDLDFSNPEAIRPYMATLPFLALMFLALMFPMLAWITGTFAGSLVACSIATARPMAFAIIVGGLVFAGTVSNLIVIPHPLWFSVLSLLGIVASAWLAMRLVTKPQVDVRPSLKST